MKLIAAIMFVGSSMCLLTCAMEINPSKVIQMLKTASPSFAIPKYAPTLFKDYSSKTGVYNLHPSQEVQFKTVEYTQLSNTTIEFDHTEYATTMNTTLAIHPTVNNYTILYDKTEYQNLNDFLTETLVYTDKMNHTHYEINYNHLPLV